MINRVSCGVCECTGNHMDLSGIWK